MPPTITPQELVAKWRGDTRKERSVAQEHFIDLCRLLGHETPGENRDGLHQHRQKGHHPHAQRAADDGRAAAPARYLLSPRWSVLAPGRTHQIEVLCLRCPAAPAFPSHGDGRLVWCRRVLHFDGRLFDDADVSELKKRTLTNLYNDRPTWLALAHKKLDAAVFDAYQWPHDLSEDEILTGLLALNLPRAAAQGGVAPISATDEDDGE